MKTQQPTPKRRPASVDEKVAETGKRLTPLILMDRDSSLRSVTIRARIVDRANGRV